MKTFKIGNDRSLKLNKKNDCISIEDKGTKRADHFTSARWASFLQCLDQIDHQLRRLSGGEDVAYCMHYGVAWHVSLTKGFRCVDLRKFFIPTGQRMWKPTKTGIALRLNEWPTFKQAIDKLHRDNPTTRPSQTSHPASSTWTMPLQSSSRHVQSAIRILRPPSNSLSCRRLRSKESLDVHSKTSTTI